MEYSHQRVVAVRRGAAASEAPGQERIYEVFHEGRQVRIRLNQPHHDRVLMIPLRNGFPLYASDRAAQCFVVLDGFGRRIANAIRLPDYGLRLVFDNPPKPGDYFIRTQTPIGRA